MSHTHKGMWLGTSPTLTKRFQRVRRLLDVAFPRVGLLDDSSLLGSLLTHVSGKMKKKIIEGGSAGV